MACPRFHVAQLSPGVVVLPDAEASHASRSRRLSPGAPIVLFDGHGHEAAGRIVSATQSGVEVEIGPVVSRHRPVPALTLAVALPKGPRQGTLVEKCTELGVACVQPLLSDRIVAAASDHRLDKWRRKAIEAAKQSGQCWLPELNAPRPVEELLTDTPRFDRALLAVCTEHGRLDRGTAPAAPEPIRDLLPALAKARTVLGFIGPEGGWTDAERETLIAAGVEPVTLGPNILRVETAAIALAAAVHALAR